EVLTVGTLLYLASLPLGYLSYREYERKDAAAAASGVVAAAEEAPALAPTAPPATDDPERPARLN
ncbi:MAG TPA: CDP-diacylglycerol--serine O-phosphatidyltransferase, partial [Xanthobacteraceae bacterium]|nr:CDP-diacylglycerol--serine O-phosphatidyltransferase [Xanthobacteraceae bacterium]